jgi:hypothetical protein
MGHFGHERRTFKGKGTIYKTDNTADIYTIPLTARILSGNTGRSVYGDSITASERVYQHASLQIQMDNILDKLIDSGSIKLAENINKNIDKIRNKAGKVAPPVKFTVGCNVTDASIELDGTAIGSPPGTFHARPGLHQIRITRQYFQPWEKTVNIHDGQSLNVALEFSSAGLRKYKNLAAFKQEQELQKLERTTAVSIAKEQSKADVGVKEKVSSGQETFLKKSYIRSDGFAEQLKRIIHGY